MIALRGGTLCAVVGIAPIGTVCYHPGMSGAEHGSRREPATNAADDGLKHGEKL